MLPNFFVVGAAKSGTTSLYRYLQSHPDIFMSPVKEPNYFSYQQISDQKLYYKEVGCKSLKNYRELFKNASSEKAIGEASVSYLFYDKVPGLIFQNIPDAKIIIVLRNPVERCYSHYLMDKRLGYVNLSLEDIIHNVSKHKYQELFYQQFVGLSFYSDQILRFMNIFPENQIKIFITEDMKSTKTFVAEVIDFLGVGDADLVATERNHNAYIKPKNSFVGFLYSTRSIRKLAKLLLPPKLSLTVKEQMMQPSEKPTLDESTKKYLVALFREDILKTGQLINRDLSFWC